MKKTAQKTVKKTVKKSVTKSVKSAPKANNLGVGVYVALTLAVYLSVYYFLTHAISAIMYMGQTELMAVSLLLTTFMSFGVLMFLTRSTLDRTIKVLGISILAVCFLYLNSTLGY